MEKSMLGQAGFMTGLDEDMLEPMIDMVKKSRAELSNRLCCVGNGSSDAGNADEENEDSLYFLRGWLYV